MKKAILVSIILFLLTIAIVRAVVLDAGTNYNPSATNVTFVINVTQTGIGYAMVNTTCLTIDGVSYCNESATPIIIQLFEPTPAEQINSTKRHIGIYDPNAVRVEYCWMFRNLSTTACYTVISDTFTLLI